eukprot:gene33557-56199_t
MAETALMAANRYRLRNMAKRGHRVAINTLWLLDRTDQLLSLILIANTLVNALATALVTAIAILFFGYDANAIAGAIALLALVLIVFAEVAPKFIGARFPENISLSASVLLKPLMAVGAPVVWLVNLFVRAVLAVLQVRPTNTQQLRMSQEELRSIVLDGGNAIPHKHK